MVNFIKYAEISGYRGGEYLNEVLEILKNRGFQIVEEDPTNTEEEGWAIYGIVK